LTYLRGAFLFHALRVEIGDQPFRDVLREFIQRNLHDTALVEDPQAITEEISGQDLDQFFTAWVTDPEVPDVPEIAES
jgi:aminopeptidase N